MYYKDEFVEDHQENLGKVTLADYFPKSWVGIGDKASPQQEQFIF